MKTYISIFCLLVLNSVSGQTDSNKPIIKSIYFGGGSYYIDEEQAEEVYKWLEGIDNIHQYKIHIKSHTDNIGSKRFNKYLSEMRSESTLLLLEQFPTKLVNLNVMDYGEEIPDYNNQSWEGKLRNRRVDIILLKLES